MYCERRATLPYSQTDEESQFVGYLSHIEKTFFFISKLYLARD